MSHLEIALFFLLIAFVYSSVGFGGGSSYLAILALYHLPFKEMRLIALLCNVVVVTGGVLIYLNKGQVNFRKIIPMVVASIPMAFIGAIFKLTQQTFFIILGCSLVAAALLLWTATTIKMDHANQPAEKTSIVKAGLLGGSIGLLSGMVGIGGGIFLSPVLNLMNWDTPKKIAATASIFIFLNSIAGIAGQLFRLPETINWLQVIILASAVFIGGQLGSRLGAIKLEQIMVRKITAIVVLVAGIEVLYKHLV